MIVLIWSLLGSDFIEPLPDHIFLEILRAGIIKLVLMHRGTIHELAH